MTLKYKRILNISVINVLNCTAEYISLVVLALYLNTNISIIQTAIVVAIPQMSSTFLGSFSSVFEKKFGTIKCMFVSSMLTGVAYIGLYLSRKMISYVIFTALWGIAVVLWKPIIKSIFSSCSEELVEAGNVHRIRYITICISSIIGPILGLLISDNYSRGFCLLTTGFLNIIIGVYIGIVFSRIFESNVYKVQEKKENISLKIFFKNGENRLLILYIITGALTYFVFAQFENIYSLFLTAFPFPEKVFSILLVLNSICGLVFQLFLIVKFQNLTAKTSVFIGNTLFQIAFFLFGISFLLINTISIWLLFAAVVIYSLGEVLTIPSLDILIDNIAPKNKKSLYFGIAELRSIGFMLGPVFAGYLLEVKNASFASFASIFIIMLANVILLFEKNRNVTRISHK